MWELISLHLRKKNELSAMWLYRTRIMYDIHNSSTEGWKCAFCVYTEGRDLCLNFNAWLINLSWEKSLDGHKLKNFISWLRRPRINRSVSIGTRTYEIHVTLKFSIKKVISPTQRHQQKQAYFPTHLLQSNKKNPNFYRPLFSA